MSTVIRYSSRDFIQINSDIKENLRAAIPEVNDFLESNEGRFLIDQWSGIAEMLGFTLDRQAAEVYIDTVETRPNLISLLKLIGYQPRNPSPEKVLATLTRNSTVDTVTVPRHSRILTSNKDGVAVQFATDYDVTFPTGTSQVEVMCSQGVWLNLQANSNGGAGQSFILPSTSIAEGYVEVTVNGVSWIQAEGNTFVGHTLEDEVFRVVALTDKRLLVEFGDGIEGSIPVKGQEIVISYMSTMGPGGHINAGGMGNVYGVNGVVARCAYPSSGGLDFETIETSRARYPRVFKTMRRAVTLEDWEALAEQVPGVLRAKAVDHNYDPSLPFFTVRVMVLGEGGVVSESLNQTVYAYLKERRVNACVFDVYSPTQVRVDVTGSIQVLRGYDKNAVLSEVYTTLQDFFTITSDNSAEVGLGRPVYLSRLITAINEVPGVASLKLTSPATDIMVAPHEFATLGTPAITYR